jgi:hypothetical protein
MLALSVPQEVPFEMYLADLSESEDGEAENNNAENKGTENDDAEDYEMSEVDNNYYNMSAENGVSAEDLQGSQFSDYIDAESIQQPRKGKMSPFHLAFGLWCENSSISRAEYRRLREVWSMAQADTEDTLLPKKLDTLKKMVRGQLPMLRLMRKPIAVTLERQPTLPAGEKATQLRTERKAWHYWYDPIDFVTKILLANDLTDKMYFGMAHYVDNPVEFWHSRAWGSSAITTSGHFAYSQKGEIIFPGDIIRLTRAVEGFTKGRVIFVGRDYRRASAIKGQITLTVQPVTSYSVLRQHNIQKLDVSHKMELYVVDKEFDITCEMVDTRLDVIVDWTFDPEDLYAVEDERSRCHFI